VAVEPANFIHVAGDAITVNGDVHAVGRDIARNETLLGKMALKGVSRRKRPLVSGAGPRPSGSAKALSRDARTLQGRSHDAPEQPLETTSHS
jgi:hypothetical protein